MSCLAPKPQGFFVEIKGYPINALRVDREQALSRGFVAQYCCAFLASVLNEVKEGKIDRAGQPAILHNILLGLSRQTSYSNFPNYSVKIMGECSSRNPILSQ